MPPENCIIVNWNTCDTLRDCLKSIYEQTWDIVSEVIVVDNASSNGSVAMVRAKFAQVILNLMTKGRDCEDNRD